MVFPGGAVDNGDVAAAEALAGAADPAAVINVAACREAFEEAGVLIATNGAGNTAGPPLSAEACALWRRRVHDRDGGAAEFVKLCSEHGLRLPRGDGSLTPLCSFITPDAEHARLPKGGFDARFVLHCCDNPAALVHASADQSETVQLEWLSPMAALAASARGEIFLAPPQVSATLPFTALSLPCHCLPLPVTACHCLSLAFHCLPLAFHCLSLAFHCIDLSSIHYLPLTVHRPFTAFH